MTRSRALISATAFLAGFWSVVGMPATALAQEDVFLASSPGEGAGTPPRQRGATPEELPAPDFVAPAPDTSSAAGVGPSYPRTLFGTVCGGLVGAAVVGGAAGLLGEAFGGDEEIVPIGAVWMTLAAPVGYWLGQAMGASRAASGPGHRLTTGELLLPAALWTGAGLATYVLIGDGFDPEDGDDLTSWYVGAALGAALQITGMSVTAYRKAVGKHRSGAVGGISFRVLPRPDGRTALGGRIRVGW